MIQANCNNNNKPFVFKILYDVCKMEFFYNTKSRTPKINQYFVLYEFTCPRFNSNYDGKTERSVCE